MEPKLQIWRDRIRAFIEANMEPVDGGIDDADDIFASGYVNSMFAMRLLNLVESLCGGTVADEDILLANFRSVDAMLALMQRQRVEA